MISTRSNRRVEGSGLLGQKVEKETLERRMMGGEEVELIRVTREFDEGVLRVPRVAGKRR